MGEEGGGGLQQFFLPKKNAESIFQTRGRDILVLDRPLWQASRQKTTTIEPKGSIWTPPPPPPMRTRVIICISVYRSLILILYFFLRFSFSFLFSLFSSLLQQSIYLLPVRQAYLRPKEFQLATLRRLEPRPERLELDFFLTVRAARVEREPQRAQQKSTDVIRAADLPRAFGRYRSHFFATERRFAADVGVTALVNPVAVVIAFGLADDLRIASATAPRQTARTFWAHLTLCRTPFAFQISIIVALSFCVVVPFRVVHVHVLEFDPVLTVLRWRRLVGDRCIVRVLILMDEREDNYTPCIPCSHYSSILHRPKHDAWSMKSLSLSGRWKYANQNLSLLIVKGL